MRGWYNDIMTEYNNSCNDKNSELHVLIQDNANEMKLVIQ